MHINYFMHNVNCYFFKYSVDFSFGSLMQRQYIVIRINGMLYYDDVEHYR